MTPFQVFLAYSKIRGIMPELKKLENYQYRMVSEYDQTTSRFTTKPGTFQDLFESHFKRNGFGNSSFLSIIYQFKDYYKVIGLPRFIKACKYWSTFVRRNVILDEPLKIGARVKCKRWANEFEGTLKSIDSDYSKFLVLGDNGSMRYITPSNILEVEGRPYEMSFHIKWKGKEYGISKKISD